MIPIDRDVPIPEDRRAPKYPFAAMRPGDSFAVPVPDGVDPRTTHRRMSAAAAHWGKAHGATFAVRLEAGDKSIRVWLVSLRATLAPVQSAPAPTGGRVHRIATGAEREDDQRAARRRA